MSKKKTVTKSAKKTLAEKAVGSKPVGSASKASPTAAVSPVSGPSAAEAGAKATRATKGAVANVAPPASSKSGTLPLAKGNPRLHPKHVSAIDAAARVLAEAKAPMTCKQMVEIMAERGLWKPATGKTPEATLYSSIHREISKKKAESRFRKTGRGLFEFAT